MGELATYSAILSKTGLGKEGNECPPKSVILALGSGLEISNADTYGDNEGVKLEDIHRSEWNYYFTIDKTSFNLPALGGNAEYKILSYKRHVVDGVEDPDAPLVPVGLNAASSGDMVWSNESDWDYIEDFTSWANREHTNYSKSRFEIISALKNRYLMFKSNWSDPSVIVRAIPAFDVKLTGVKEGLTVGYRYITGNWDEGVGANLGINEISLKNNEINHLPAGVDSDGVHVTEVGFTLLTNPPDFSDAIGITVEQVVEKFNGRLVVSENQALTAKASTVVYTQKESGKTLTINLTQAAATSTWEYTFTKSSNWGEVNPVIGALGGNLDSSGSPKGVSTKQEYRNGKVYGSSINVTCDITVDVDWITLPVPFLEDLSQGNTWIQVFSENKSESQRTGNLIFTQRESGKTFTIKRIQSAGAKTYGTPTVYLGTATDIPASGGTSVNPSYTYAQLWGWNGKTSDGGTISTGATVSWSASISGSNLGTTSKARTRLGARTLTVTLNGKTNTASYDVYQAENKIVSSTAWDYTVNLSVNPKTVSNLGGTVNISAEGIGNRTHTWSSGGKSDEESFGSPRLSLIAQVEGFTLSGNTLTITENPTPNERTVVVRADYEDVFAEESVTQTAYVVTYEYVFTTSTPTLSYPASGNLTKTFVIESYRNKYINNVFTAKEDVGYSIPSGGTGINIASYNLPNKTITMRENDTEWERSSSATFHQTGSDKRIEITCNQAAGTVTNENIVELVGDFPSIANTGGILKGNIRSGYYKVINGVRDTFYNAQPTLDGILPSWLSNLKFVRSDGIIGNKEFNYEVQITASENTDENIRRSSIKLVRGNTNATMNIAQVGANITWEYEFEVKNLPPNIRYISGAGEEISFVIVSWRTKVVNGTVTDVIERVTPTVTEDASWINVLRIQPSDSSYGEYDVDIEIEANPSPTNSRTQLITVSNGISLKYVNLIQNEAEVTTVFTLKYIDGETTTWNPNAKAQSISINVISYKEEFINGVLNRTTQVLPTPSFIPMNINWATIEVMSMGSSSNGYEYMFELIIESNPTESERSLEITWGPDMAGPPYKVTQQAAQVEWRGTMYFGDYGGGGTNSTTFIVQKDDTSVRTVKLQSYKSKYINDIEDTNTRVAMNFTYDYPTINSWALISHSVKGIETTITLKASSINDLVERSVIARFTPDDSSITNATAIGTRTLTFTQRGVPIVRMYNFGWKDQINVIKEVSFGTGNEGISLEVTCYTYLANATTGVEIEGYRDYFLPSIVELGDSWATLIPNSESADHTWTYGLMVQSNSTGASRSTSFALRNDHPQNGNPQTINLYINQSGSIMTVDCYNLPPSSAGGNYQQLSIEHFNSDGDHSDRMPNMSAGNYLQAQSSIGKGKKITVRFKCIFTSDLNLNSKLAYPCIAYINVGGDEAKIGLVEEGYTVLQNFYVGPITFKSSYGDKVRITREIDGDNKVRFTLGKKDTMLEWLENTLLATCIIQSAVVDNPYIQVEFYYGDASDPIIPIS